MPIKPKRACKHTGCPLLTDHDYCQYHSKLHSKDRSSANERGYNSRWQRVRKQFLTANPFCSECIKENRITIASVVDHVTPHRGDEIVFWDESNWQSLCKRCHDKKTRKLDQYQVYSY